MVILLRWVPSCGQLDIGQFLGNLWVFGFHPTGFFSLELKKISSLCPWIVSSHVHCTLRVLEADKRLYRPLPLYLQTLITPLPYVFKGKSLQKKHNQMHLVCTLIQDVTQKYLHISVEYVLHLLNTNVQLLFLVTSMEFFLDAVVEYDRFLTMGKKRVFLFFINLNWIFTDYLQILEAIMFLFCFFFCWGGLPRLCVDRLFF